MRPTDQLTQNPVVCSFILVNCQKKVSILYTFVFFSALCIIPYRDAVSVNIEIREQVPSQDTCDMSWRFFWSGLICLSTNYLISKIHLAAPKISQAIFLFFLLSHRGKKKINPSSSFLQVTEHLWHLNYHFSFSPFWLTFIHFRVDSDLQDKSAVYYFFNLFFILITFSNTWRTNVDHPEHHYLKSSSSSWQYKING